MIFGLNFLKVLSVTTNSIHVEEDSFIVSAEKNSEDQTDLKCAGFLISSNGDTHNMKMRASIKKDIIFFLIFFLKIEFD
jgi:hypothetical protein